MFCFIFGGEIIWREILSRLSMLWYFSMLIFLFACSSPNKHINTDLKRKREDVELIFPDLLVRSFECGNKCGEQDANREFEESVDKQRIIKLLSMARKDIFLAQFTNLDSYDVFKELIEAASRDVKVEVFADRSNFDRGEIPESILSLVSTQSFKNLGIKERLQALRADSGYVNTKRLPLLSFILNESKNGNAVKFNRDFGGMSTHFHMKFILVDKQYLVTASGNLSYTGLGYSYEIFSYYDKTGSSSKVNPFICAAEKLFSNPEDVDSCNSQDVIFSVPGKDVVFNFVKSSFELAQNRIWVAGNQFGTELFLDTVSKVKPKGVDFRILTGSNVCAAHPRLNNYAHNGISVRCLPVNYCFYQQFHNKYFIVDDALYYGTLNTDFDGFFRFWDFLIKDEQFSERLKEHFEKHWGKANVFDEIFCNNDSTCLAKHCVD